MKTCHNCKFIQYEMYSSHKCKANFTLDNSNGTYKKRYKNASDVRIDEGNCEFYKHNWVMKLKIRIGSIQGWWYSRKMPEKMI
jgi:hypothetical protein